MSGTALNAQATYNVLMTASGSSWEVRAVTLPVSAYPESELELLTRIYAYGQNDYDATPHGHPSVSYGDIILIGAERWLICREGFRLLTREEFANYCRTARSSRAFSSLLNSPNNKEIEMRGWLYAKT